MSAPRGRRTKYAQLVAGIRAAKPPNSRPLRILIDGPSGAGKTTLADRLGAETGALVLHSDDWVPGWEGLSHGTRITEQLVTGAQPCYRRFDWDASRLSDVVCPDPLRPWIIEGCGTITPQSAAAADVTIWVEADPALAKQRALRRDGVTFAPWWDTWKKQERNHFNKHDPFTLADLVFTT